MSVPREVVVAAAKAVVADRYATAAALASAEAEHSAGMVMQRGRVQNAAANATRNAAGAAHEAGAFRAARRAEHAADVADYRAEMARERAARSIYAPFTA